MPQAKIWFLQNINLFKEMNSEEIREIDRMTRMEFVKKKAPIYLMGAPSQQVYLLKAGRVKISRVSEHGREVTFTLLEPGEIFGELEVLQDSARAASAEALDDIQLCVIQKEQFLSMIRRNPELSFRLTKLIGSRLTRIESRVEDLVFRDVPSRLAQLLLQISNDHGRAAPRGIQINIKITHQEMANLIGSIRETVSVVLGEFKKEGLVTLDGRQITILRPDLLKLRLGSSCARSAQAR